MKILVDAFGGDYAPDEIIKGTIEALAADSDINVILSGDSDIIGEKLKVFNYDSSRLEILDAKEVITNDESPTEAVRKKKDSSIVKGFNKLNSDDDIKAFVSCGSSGAVLTGAVLLLRRIKGVARPALAPVLPTVDGGNVILIDCGANADCKALNLVQFALIGKAYAESSGIKEPRIALLSNGAEDKKGNELMKEAFPLLKDNPELNFIGNMEARDLLSGTADVVVADGFSGNVALKASEGAALMMLKLLKKGIMGGGIRSKIGYLLLKPVFKKVKKVMDYNDNGGAVLLGLNKLVIKSHGSSKAKAVAASILQAKRLSEIGITERIKEAMDKEKEPAL